jgi:hypothetical protein
MDYLACFIAALSIRVFQPVGHEMMKTPNRQRQGVVRNLIETHEHNGDFKE